MTENMRLLQEIESEINNLRSHIEFLVKTNQFDELEGVRDSLISFLADIYVKYENSYED